ncbi:MAG TPA: protein-L-isoaspartate(D-aspartate) O-methyltransferase [Pirellulaceae bacterium]|nr:protein-L-isoaspartate(D-aspartate) O-methyltransferase [Pirellulaceae bacterium]
MIVPFRSLAAAMLAVVSLLSVSAPTASAQPRVNYEAARKLMVDEFIVGCGVRNERVIQAMLAVARHEFVPVRLRNQAYFDSAIAIGESQTISSPFIVAYMTESLDPQPTDKVLEIGTGSGYQAAVLGEIVGEVYTIEIVEELGKKAAETLEHLKYENVHVKVGDGFRGWPEHAPFDKIIVTCSPENVPQPLIDQLAEGGRMVIPVGERYQQTLYLFRKEQGELVAEPLRPTLFVPMTGRAESLREVQPDPTNPSIVNGDFELSEDDPKIIPGWYYERQVESIEDIKAPQGKRFVRFDNEHLGRSSHLLQGFPIDGAQVPAIEVRAHVRSDLTFPGTAKSDVPLLAISFYDEERRDLGAAIIGPFIGSQDWHEEVKVIPVPRTAKEAIIRIGLFGATGSLSFDDIRVRKTVLPK